MNQKSNAQKTAPSATPSHPAALRSLHSRSFDAWRSPNRFTKNPDLVRMPSGRLIFIYSDNDRHWSQETQVLTLVASDDQGATWFKLNEIVSADLRTGDERLVTPRLSLLSDGRLVALIDHDDFGHFHEDQVFGNWIFFSSDGGLTWTKPVVPAIPGFEPDRVMELPDGSLAVVSQYMRGESQEFAVAISFSHDGGATWKETATIAHDGYHRYCEGALVILKRGEAGTELACVMRENHSSGIPSLVSFSQDNGRTWTAPVMCPFGIHRPYAKQLPDGRVLVTGRHVNGQVGCVAWCGDLRAEAGQHQIGGPRSPQLSSMTSDALVITNSPDRRACRYSLLPAESPLSEIFFEARVKVAGGEPGKAVALMSICKIMNMRSAALVLSIGTDFVCFGNPEVDSMKKVDMTTYRTVTIHLRKGVLTVAVDGKHIINQCIPREEFSLCEWFSEDPSRRTMFGNAWDSGTSSWQSITYRHVNQTLPDYAWSWKASDGRFPNDYQIRRLVELHGNPPGVDQVLDLGYSSWVVMPDGHIVFVDYSSQGDPQTKSHIVGLRFHPSEIPS
jgi:hypothetical protein